MASDLIGRLRDAANGLCDLKSPQGDYGLCDDAADALEAKDREIERLREGLTTALRLGRAYASGTGTLFDEGMAKAESALSPLSGGRHD